MATKILHVIARMNVGGTARYVSELVERIPDSRLATGFVQGLEIEDPYVKNLQVIRIRSMGRKISPVNDFFSWIELRKIIKEVKPEIVHTHTFKAGLIGRLIGGQHMRVHTFHGHLIDDQSFSRIGKIFITLAERYLANRTDLLISVGKKVGIELRAQRIGADRDWVSIPPGVEPLLKIDKTIARATLGLKQDAVLVGWLARMAPVKNPTLLLEVARKLPSVTFVMAGGGDLLASIKSNAPKNVLVLGWIDAAAFWSAVDCAISTSDNEGMPISLIEAQLSGLAAIATDVGSNSEIIENEVTGFITSKDTYALIAATKKLMENKKLRDSMGARAKEKASSNFNIKKMITMHSDSYKRLNFRK